MAASALEQVDQTGPALTDRNKDSWLGRLKEHLRSAAHPRALDYQTSVHPCVIDGERTLVHERGLGTRRPGALAALRRYAGEHGFRLKEDQRSSDRPVSAERRARLVPMLALGMTLGGMTATAAEDVDGPAASGDGVGPIEEVTVIGVREGKQREYLIEAGKRFIAGPFGEVEAIVSIADQVRRSGEHKRISTRGMVVPDPGMNSIVDRYDYTFPASCGGGKFSYYEGAGFSALGYHGGKRVILDVLVGGGPFTAPKLWGPYDQILNDNTRMHLMSGNGREDGMGLLKASYSIGMVADMSGHKMRRGGEVYQKAVRTTAGCEGIDPDTVAVTGRADKRVGSEG